MLKFEFTAQQLDVIYQALHELPAKTSIAVIKAIEEQYKQQQMQAKSDNQDFAE